MHAGGETHINQDGVDQLVPVARAAAQSIQCLLQEPEDVLPRVRVTWRRPDDGGLVVGKASIAEGILAVALLEDTAALGSH